MGEDLGGNQDGLRLRSANMDERKAKIWEGTNYLQFFNLRLKMTKSLGGEPYRFFTIRSELKVLFSF